MSTIQIDDALRARLNGLDENVAFCDESGTTLGYFVPDAFFKKLVFAWMDSQVTDAELEQIRQEPGGRSLKEIWKSLGRS